VNILFTEVGRTLPAQATSGKRYTMVFQAKFTHRHNMDGTHDSICRECLVTIATVEKEDDLAGFESGHSCDPVRAYRRSQGYIVGDAARAF
jgi:hypothetical protein